MDNGQVIFVWNALPGETVRFRIVKQKRSYIEAIAEEIIIRSPEREIPQDDIFLSTAPWQILSSEGENRARLAIVEELMRSAKITIPAISYHDSIKKLHYRNKMEYGFWGDDHGLHLALHGRATHLKQVVTGSSLAMPAIDTAAHALLAELMRSGVRAADLKSVVIRASRQDKVAMSLFTKRSDFAKLHLPDKVQGLNVYYSDHKSPASVATKLLVTLGDTTLSDELMGRGFWYGPDSFFQVNLDVFEQVLQKIKGSIDATDLVVDMYSGVGTIGLSMDSAEVELVEINDGSSSYAARNAENLNIKAKITVASSETVLDLIPSRGCIIFDPPRAGLHHKIIDRLLSQRPQRIVYLSCNPATLARDMGLLKAEYNIDSLDVYNFFPKTPHIESLVILSPKGN